MRAGDALRVSDPSSAMAYRLSRIGLWLLMQQDPPAQEGQTYLPSPPEHVRAALQGMFEASNWDGLLGSIDAVVAEHRLWLDPHRFASAALDGLGYADAKVAYLKELAL